MEQLIPVPVRDILQGLNQAGFKAYIVGGSVRDILLDRTPKDWDITTDALPEKIMEIFPESFYENTFGTVGVKVKVGEKTEEVIEVTTFRLESGYEDKRHPSEVRFTQRVEDDLARRDFTINAMAYGRDTEAAWNLVDPFGGKADLEAGIVRAVGNPHHRFEEDALRLMRAVRLVTELRGENPKRDWRLEEYTLSALKELSENIKAISQERIRDEFSKILLSAKPKEGVELLEETGLLRSFLPELREGIDVTQNLHHIYTVWEHNLRALETCPSQKLSVRLAALLHDVAKPRTKRGEGYRSTFYNHDHVGARMTTEILTRLRYPQAVVKKAALLVDNHLFYYNVGEVTEASVRRLIKRVGLENMDDLMAVRIGDRLGSGVPKAKPYKLRHLEYMIEKVSQDPLSVKMLAIKGTDLMEELALPAGPQIGAVLDVLLAEVIEDPKRNSRGYLLERAQALKGEKLEELRAIAKKKVESEKQASDKDIKKRHWVS